MVREDQAVFLKEAHIKKQQFYNENPNLDYIATAEEKVHAMFDGMVKASGQPVTVHIQQVHRVRQGGFKNVDERVYFYEEHKSKDARGNKIEKFMINGKYDIPIGQFQYNELTNTTTAIGIDSYETEFPIKYDPKILEELVDNGQIDNATTYYVETPNGRQYSGFEYDDFRNMSFDDLVFLGKTGAHPEQQLQEVKSRDKKIATGTKD